MSSGSVRRAKSRRQFVPNGPALSVRIRAVAVVICASRSAGGRVCGRLERYEHDEPEGSLDMARADGWTFRSGQARCRQCGNEGASFGAAS